MHSMHGMHNMHDMHSMHMLADKLQTACMACTCWQRYTSVMIIVAGGLASLAFALLATSNASDVHVITDTSCMCRLIFWELDQLSPPSTGVPVPSTSGELHTHAQRLNANTCVVVAHPMHKALVINSNVCMCMYLCRPFPLLCCRFPTGFAVG